MSMTFDQAIRIIATTNDRAFAKRALAAAIRNSGYEHRIDQNYLNQILESRDWRIAMTRGSTASAITLNRLNDFFGALRYLYPDLQRAFAVALDEYCQQQGHRYY